MTCFWYITSI